MWIRKLAAFLLAGMLFLFQSVPVHAQMPPGAFQGTKEEVSVSPLWVNVNDITLDLYFERGEACCAGKIRALSGTTKISAAFKLERKSGTGWVLEKSWSQSSNTNSLSFFGTDAVKAGYTYRFSAALDVIRNGVTETINTSVESKY